MTDAATQPERERRGASGNPGAAYAALDLGTNNCRLLVARPAGAGFRVIDAFSRMVRLGEGLGATGHLSDAAQARTVAALRVCADKMRQRGVIRSRAVTTEACRRAGNCGQFLDRVKQQTGIELEIISNDEEAFLALFGCVPLLDSAVPYALVFDIGGGSTELACLEVGRATQLLAGGRPPPGDFHSMPLGVANLAERHGGRDATPDGYRAMVAEVLAAAAPFEAARGLARPIAQGRVQMLGTSGTVTILACVHQNLRRYDRARVDGSFLDFATVRRISRRIAAMSYESRIAHPCIGRDRADYVVAGCAILEGLCRIWPVGRIRVADRGLREGILLTLMGAAPAAGMEPPDGAAARPV